MVSTRTELDNGFGVSHYVYQRPYGSPLDLKPPNLLEVHHFRPEQENSAKFPIVVVPGWSEDARHWKTEANILATLGREVWISGSSHGISYEEVFPHVGAFDNPLLDTLMRRVASMRITVDAVRQSGENAESRIALAPHSLGNIDAIFFASLFPDEVSCIAGNTLAGAIGHDTTLQLMKRFSHEMLSETGKTVRDSGKNLLRRATSKPTIPVFNARASQIGTLARHPIRSAREVRLIAHSDVSTLATEVHDAGAHIGWRWGTTDRAFPNDRRSLDETVLDIANAITDADHNDVHRNPRLHMTELNRQIEAFEAQAA